MTPAAFDPLEVLTVFAKHGVRFVLIGGLAGRVWGSPSITNDLDACYDRHPDNLRHLADALVDLDARLRIGGPDPDVDLPFILDAETLRQGLKLSFRTRAGAVDVLGLPAGISGYEELAANAVEEDLGGVPVKVAALDDLIAMKLAAGRPKDRIEVEVLAAVREEIESR